jgi:hypothetical protein
VAVAALAVGLLVLVGLVAANALMGSGAPAGTRHTPSASTPDGVATSTTEPATTPFTTSPAAPTTTPTTSVPVASTRRPAAGSVAPTATPRGSTSPSGTSTSTKRPHPTHPPKPTKTETGAPAPVSVDDLLRLLGLATTLGGSPGTIAGVGK